MPCPAQLLSCLGADPAYGHRTVSSTYSDFSLPSLPLHLALVEEANASAWPGWMHSVCCSSRRYLWRAINGLCGSVIRWHLLADGGTSGCLQLPTQHQEPMGWAQAGWQWCFRGNSADKASGAKVAWAGPLLLAWCWAAQAGARGSHLELWDLPWGVLAHKSSCVWEAPSQASPGKRYSC